MASSSPPSSPRSPRTSTRALQVRTRFPISHHNDLVPAAETAVDAFDAYTGLLRRFRMYCKEDVQVDEILDWLDDETYIEEEHLATISQAIALELGYLASDAF